MEIIGSALYIMAFSERERRFKDIALRVQPRQLTAYTSHIYIYYYIGDERNKSDRVINYKK